MPDPLLPLHPSGPHNPTAPSPASDELHLAEQLARRTLHDNPHSAQARLNLAFSLEMLGRNEEALLEYLETMCRSRSNLDAALSLAAAFRRRARWTLALEAYSRARELAPDDAHALGGLGEVLYQMKSPSAARPHLERACRILPDDPLIWCSVGRVRAVLGDSLGAVQAFRNAVEIRPDDHEIHRFLGHALCLSGDAVGARVEFERAIELAPHDAPAHWALGRLLREWNRLDDALAHLREATLLSSNDIEIWCDLAIAEARAGNTMDARHALHMVSKLDAGFIRESKELSELATLLNQAVGELERPTAHDAPTTGPDGFGCERCRITPVEGKHPPFERRRLLARSGRMEYELVLCRHCRQYFLRLSVGMAHAGDDAHGEWRTWVPLMGREVDEVEICLPRTITLGRPRLLDRLIRVRRRLVEYPGGKFAWCDPRMEDVPP